MNWMYGGGANVWPGAADTAGAGGAAHLVFGMNGRGAGAGGVGILRAADFRGRPRPDPPLERRSILRAQVRFAADEQDGECDRGNHRDTEAVDALPRIESHGRHLVSRAEQGDDSPRFYSRGRRAGVRRIRVASSRILTSVA